MPPPTSSVTAGSGPAPGAATRRQLAATAGASALAVTGTLVLEAVGTALAPGLAAWQSQALTIGVNATAAAAVAAVWWSRRTRLAGALADSRSALGRTEAALGTARRELQDLLAQRAEQLASSEQHLAESERAAERERARLLAAIDETTQALVMAAADGTISYVNRAFERITGLAAAVVVGEHVSMIGGQAQNTEAFDEMLATIAAGKTWHGELRNRRGDGAEYTLETDVTPFHDEAGAAAGFIAIGEEITGRRMLEAQFRQAQKMEAVGRLAGGVAHDFNNILTVILGHAEVLLSSEALDEDLRASAEAIHDAGNRAARLTRQLLTFSRQKAVVTQRVDVNDIVRNIEPMVRSLVGEDISVLVATAAGGTPVVADASQIEQIVMNLVVNARDAMPRGGTLTIETLNTRFRSEHAVRHGVLPPGDYVLLAISDTGHGIERAIQERIFEPFYTTKETGKGTGLGLSTVYGIATQHGGQVEVYSEPGEGTTFKVYLPCAERGSAAIETEPRDEHITGDETVLIVEDNDGVRELLRKSLQQHGYTVIESRNGDEALLFSQRYAGEIHILVTDVIMPRMNGVEVADAIAKQRPMIRTLFMSGYTDHSVIQHAEIDERAFLRKPFSMESAVARVRRALDDPRTERGFRAAGL